MNADQVRGKVLIVDDEVELCSMLAMILERHGFTSAVANDGYTAMQMIQSENPDVVLLDSVMPDPNGMAVLRFIREISPHLPVIMMSAYPGMNSAICAVKAGAWEYLPKPFDNQKLLNLLERAIAATASIDLGQSEIQTSDAFKSLLRHMGSSLEVVNLGESLIRVAKTDYSVLIQGETGTGKELVARHIHMASHRSAAPFIAVDCGALQDSLVENEFFGHEKGAYTGAHVEKVGQFEAASGGTIFLDEIGNLSLVAQVKLLRALQEKVIKRVGGVKSIPINVRIVAATNDALMESIIDGRFREDLYYRLNEFSLFIPPLRNRGNDVLYLAQRFINEACDELHLGQPPIINSKVHLALCLYRWPGNVRELRSKMRRALITSGTEITLEQLGLGGREQSQANESTSIGEITVESGSSCQDLTSYIENLLHMGDNSMKSIVQKVVEKTERQIIDSALKTTNGNKAKAARLLKVDYKTLFNKLNRYNEED